MQVVVDTSVMIFALLWLGLPHRLIELAEAGLISLCVTEETLSELYEVLNRPKFAAKIRQRRTTPDELFQGVVQLAELYPRTASVKVIAADPDDDMFIACALSADAQYIISGDEHLLKLKQYKTISIVTVRTFLEREFPESLVGRVHL